MSSGDSDCGHAVLADLTAEPVAQHSVPSQDAKMDGSASAMKPPPKPDPSLRARRRSLRVPTMTEEQTHALMADPRHKDLVQSFALRHQQKKVNDMLGASILLLFVLVVVEEDARSNWLLLAITATVAVQVWLLFQFYDKELRRTQVRDPLWRDLTLLSSPLWLEFCLEVAIHLLHCPPFLPHVWSAAHQLNILTWLRVYVFLRLFRDRAFGASGSRIVASLSQTNLDLPFIIKTTLYKDPFPLSVGSLLITFWIMSFCMYQAERDCGMSLDDALWLTAVTFTTVGYGNITPATSVGRIIAIMSAIIGIVFTALITAIIHRSLTISKTQKQMVLFMMECGQSMNIKVCAAQVIRQAWNMHKLAGRPAREPALRRLNRTCARFRALRRREGMIEIDILEMLIADPRYVLSQNTLLQQLCQSTAEVAGEDEMEAEDELQASADQAADAQDNADSLLLRSGGSPVGEGSRRGVGGSPRQRRGSDSTCSEISMVSRSRSRSVRSSCAGLLSPRSLLAGLGAVVTGQVKPRPPGVPGRASVFAEDEWGCRRGSASSATSQASQLGSSLRRLRAPTASPLSASPPPPPQPPPVEVQKLTDRVGRLESSLAQMGSKMDSVESSLALILRELREDDQAS